MTPIDPAERDALLDELRAEGRRVLSRRRRAADDAIRFRYGVDARYLGQGNEITIWVGEGDDLAGHRRPRSSSAFEAEYRRIYGLTIPDVGRRGGHVAAVGVAGADRGRAVDHARARRGRSPSPRSRRPMVFGRGDRRRSTRRSTAASDLGVGQRFDGPAIVEERETTAVIRPGWTVEVAADGSLIATAQRRSQRGAVMTIADATTSDASTRTFDPIELEVLWQSLIATVNEQARALQRAAFSPIVREAGDLANAVFDRRGRMVAQAVTGTPGHINSLARRRSAMLDEYPHRLARSRATC